MSADINIIAYKCKNCGKMHYPYHDRCLKCKTRDFLPVKLHGDTRLITFTQIFNLPGGFDQRFLIIGVAEFENGVKAMGQIKADSIDHLELGMKMKSCWEVVRFQAGEDVYGLVFEPII